MRIEYIYIYLFVFPRLPDKMSHCPFLYYDYIFTHTIKHPVPSLKKRHLLLTTELNWGFVSMGGPGHFTQIKYESLYTKSLWPIQLLDHHEKCYHLTFLPSTKSKNHLEPTLSSLLTSRCNKIFSSYAFLKLILSTPHMSEPDTAPTVFYCCHFLKLLAQSPSSFS